METYGPIAGEAPDVSSIDAEKMADIEAALAANPDYQAAVAELADLASDEETPIDHRAVFAAIRAGSQGRCNPEKESK